MDELLKQVILSAPNVAVAIVALFWAGKVIERQIEATGRLVDRLLELMTQVEQLEKQVASTRQEETH